MDGKLKRILDDAGAGHRLGTEDALALFSTRDGRSGPSLPLPTRHVRNGLATT